MVGVKRDVKYGQQKKKAPFDWRGTGKEEGLGGFFAGIAGGLSDLGRGAANTTGSAIDFLTSRPQGSSRFGDDLFGPDKTPSRGRRGGGGSFANERLEQQNQQAEVAADSSAKGILDFLQQAIGLGAGAGGGASAVSYDPLRAAARSRFQEGDARLEAMYRQLANSISGQAATIGGNYDAGAAAYGQNAQQAASTVNDAYTSSRDAQTAQLQRLGIGDAAAVIAAQGTDASRDQAAALSGIEQNRAANVGANEAAKQAALQQNQTGVSAAGLQGATERGRLQQALDQQLAEFDVAEQTQNQQLAQQRSNGLGEQLQVAQMLQEDYNSRLPQGPTFDEQIALEELALKRLQAAGSGRTLQDALGDIGQLQAYAKQNGIPEDKFSEFAKLVLGNV